MLKHIDPLLTPDLLWVLAAMGHGDDLALVDANFPAEAIAASTVSRRLVRLPGLRMGAVMRAVLSVLPLDDFVPDPVRRMEVVGEPTQIPPAQAEVLHAMGTALGHAVRMQGIERFAFYAAARDSFAIVQVGDLRPYGDFLLRKGVILGA
ncbi:RbsD/FucU family protein [Roseomonas marmotae]|uniref:Fucose-binding protein n=1 Tax=Roseomonas marmotae TaxID=2768161 RepID=A0ABS3KFF9_9PROT|nr:RbsD/FucU domain-containing protein [Roseomonas marmotae]MBO1076209.1 fucose-binding protein [Roseomonas marmotae]QTI82001.1 fucose-binding protein [Roseomonas marmotae]